MNSISGMNQSDPEKMVELYFKNQMCPKDIGASLGVSLSTVRRAIIRAGHVLRGPKEAGPLTSARKSAARLGRKFPISESARENIRAAVRVRDEGRVFKGKRIRPSGYVEITAGKHARRDEHVVLMEGIIGRRLNKDEVVHHIDHDRANNSPSNLRLMTRAEHTSLHRKEKANKHE